MVVSWWPRSTLAHGRFTSTKILNDPFMHKRITQASTAGRLSIPLLNPELIIPHPVLHAKQKKDSTQSLSEVFALVSAPVSSLKMSQNRVKRTGAPHMTEPRQRVQPNWMDLWFEGVSARRHHVLQTRSAIHYGEKQRGQIHQKGKVKAPLESQQFLYKRVKLAEGEEQQGERGGGERERECKSRHERESIVEDG